MIVDLHSSVGFQAVPSRVIKLRRTSAWHTLRGFASVEIVSLVLCFLMSGSHPRPTTAEPSIEFSKIPPAMQGGREKVDTISGRVTGARRGQQIVVYARSGPWWVQPWPTAPFIPIRSDSTWSTQTHLGFEYAALLVEPGYQPSPTMDVLPPRGGPIVAIAAVKGVGPIALAPTTPVHFSGYDWKVRT